jgi:predicted RecB family nuclease
MERVMALLPEVRRARRYGIQPQICGCRVCSTLRRDEVLASVTRRKDTTLLFGVARVYAQSLTLAGYPTWTSLMNCDPAVLAEQFSAGGHKAVTTREVQRWQLHAGSYRANAPLLADWACAFPAGDTYLALDLEYDPDDAGVWLIGACLVAGEDRTWKFYWADSAREQIENLRNLARLVARHSGLPVVTWSGVSADIPILRKASELHRLGPILDGLFGNHVDAYQWTVDNLRLPVPGLGLNDVAAYFGVPRLSDVRDGLQALLLYQQYLHTKSPELKERLINYNRDDLEALISVTGHIREIATVAEGRVQGGASDANPRRRPQFTRSNRANDTVHAELGLVPRGPKGGPERRYRAVYAAYRLKALGRNPGGCDPTRKAAHEYALEVVRLEFPDFHPRWS